MALHKITYKYYYYYISKTKISHKISSLLKQKYFSVKRWKLLYAIIETE